MKALIIAIWRFFNPVPLRIRFCRLQPLYSECCIYKWRCARCGLSQFGDETKKPACNHFKKAVA